MRTASGDRALGPYRDPKVGLPGRYIVLVYRAGAAARKTKPERSQFPERGRFTTEAEERAALVEARAFVATFTADARLREGVTIEEAMEGYPAYLAKPADPTVPVAPGRKPRRAKRPGSIKTDIFRLRNMFPEVARMLPGPIILPADAPEGREVYPRQLPVRDLDDPMALALYERLRVASKSEATVLYTLATGRKFLDYCVEKRWINQNVFAHFRPALESNDGGKGKNQLSYDELKIWEDKAFELAFGGDVGAAAALFAFHLSPRAGIIVTRRARDVDAGGSILRTAPLDWRPNRTKKVPPSLPIEDPRLQQVALSLRVGLAPEAWLFPTSNRVRPGRRQFSQGERDKILAEYDQALAVGDGSGREVLGRYEIDSSQIWHWRRRKARPVFELAGVPAPVLPRGHRDPSWVKEQVRRICRAAGLPDTTHAHGMRGASMSTDFIDGATLADVQRRAGHDPGSKVTLRAYMMADAIARRRQRALAGLMAVSGGKAP